MRTWTTLLLFICACGARTAPLINDESHDASRAACTPAAEVCNRSDDDCDGSIDEGLPLTALGDPVVLRSPGETTTGDCGECDRAWHGEVIEVDGGLLVIWQMFFASNDPQPNMFARRLDGDGTPTEPPQPWSDRYTTQSLEALVLPDGRRALAFCERVPEDRENEQYPSLWLVDGAGAAQGALIRVSSDRCSGDGVRAGSTGAHSLFAFASDGLHTDLALVDLSLRTVSQIPAGPGTHVRMATAPIGALLLRRIPAPPGTGEPDHFSMQVFDATGAPSGAPTAESFDERFARWEGVATREGGWWLLQAGDGGLRMSALSGAATPADEPRRFGVDEGVHAAAAVALPNDGLVVVAEPTRGDAVIQWSRLYVLDRDGLVVSTWKSDELGEPAWRSATLRLIAGRLAIVYLTDAPDAYRNEVRMRLLGCVP